MFGHIVLTKIKHEEIITTDKKIIYIPTISYPVHKICKRCKQDVSNKYFKEEETI